MADEISARRILSIGEMMLELSRAPDGTLSSAFGGDTYNTAVYLSRLGQATGYVSALGDDPWSDEARACLKREGVDDSLVMTAAGRTIGLYAIRTTPDGERSFTYWRDSAPARDLFGALHSPAIDAALRSAQLIYLSGISLWLFGQAGRSRLLAALRQARMAGARVAFDGNFRPRLWGKDMEAARKAYAATLALTDMCLATAEDEALLWGDGSAEETRRRLSGIGIAEVVVKMGVAGALAGPGTHVPTTPLARPVDTTAAGDSFNAAYLDARLRGLAPEDAAAAGNRLALRVISYPGAIIPADAMP